MPKPPGLSKEKSNEWDKREDNYFKVMIILMTIASGLFFILIIVIVIASLIYHK